MLIFNLNHSIYWLLIFKILIYFEIDKLIIYLVKILSLRKIYFTIKILIKSFLILNFFEIILN